MKLKSKMKQVKKEEKEVIPEHQEVKKEEITPEQWISAFQNQGVYNFYQLGELKKLNENLEKISRILFSMGQIMENSEESEEKSDEEESDDDEDEEEEEE